MSERHRSIVDVHLVLVEDGRILLSRRHNTGYEDGRYHLVSGHLEAGESIVDAVVREAAEEIGIGLAADDLDCVHVMHHSNPGEEARVGFFFRAWAWTGEPVNREPEKCSDLAWFPLDALPRNVIAYPAEALRHIADGVPFSLHGW
ncbi:NUDIX domain-containing protein [Allokutzneria sp. NRRL B-24872]|uniref:NUDIX hydrolase n=1 Tax=Allokutzneria sp. NRRL B-24872 TaxID=1137961 RepID=UPI000A35F969|nr:NUDIX domain-containing protein [Allokutzneria sp. NRRL B-24872]